MADETGGTTAMFSVGCASGTQQLTGTAAAKDDTEEEELEMEWATGRATEETARGEQNEPEGSAEHKGAVTVESRGGRHGEESGGGEKSTAACGWGDDDDDDDDDEEAVGHEKVITGDAVHEDDSEKRDIAAVVRVHVMRSVAGLSLATKSDIIVAPTEASAL